MKSSKRFFSLLIIIAIILPLVFGCSVKDGNTGGGSGFINGDTDDYTDDNNDDPSSDDDDEGDKDDPSSDDNDEGDKDDPSSDDNNENNKESVVLFDSTSLGGTSPFLPSYAPFSLYDTTVFSNSVITSISFPFSALASGYTTESEGLIMPIYVIQNDFSSKKSDCTVENGKKIELDFTGKLDGVKSGDIITADGLNIVVSKDETLAFGDTDMVVLPGFLRDNGTHGFYNKIFDNKGPNNHSLTFKIEGYSLDDDAPSNTGDGKTYISFLGDSISTFDGWSDNTEHNFSIGANAIWYPNNNYAGANMKVEDTWWHRVFTGLELELAVNNSWSSSVVTTAQTYNVRAKNLHNTSSGANPNIVVILMGINDFAAGTKVGNHDGTSDAPANPTTFSEAYARLIQNISNTYDDIEIYCCTILPDLKRFSSTKNGNGTDLSEYNNAISKIATNMGANVIDLNTICNISSSNISQYTVDRLHPNSKGMELIADTIIEAIEK